MVTLFFFLFFLITQLCDSTIKTQWKQINLHLVSRKHTKHSNQEQEHEMLIIVEVVVTLKGPVYSVRSACQMIRLLQNLVSSHFSDIHAVKKR